MSATQEVPIYAQKSMPIKNMTYKIFLLDKETVTTKIPCTLCNTSIPITCTSCKYKQKKLDFDKTKVCSKFIMSKMWIYKKCGDL